MRTRPTKRWIFPLFDLNTRTRLWAQAYTQSTPCAAFIMFCLQSNTRLSVHWYRNGFVRRTAEFEFRLILSCPCLLLVWNWCKFFNSCDFSVCILWAHSLIKKSLLQILPYHQFYVSKIRYWIQSSCGIWIMITFQYIFNIFAGEFIPVLSANKNWDCSNKHERCVFTAKISRSKVCHKRYE